MFTGQLSVVLGSLKGGTVSPLRLSKATKKAFPYILTFAFSLSGEVTYSVWKYNITLFMASVK